MSVGRSVWTRIGMPLDLKRFGAFAACGPIRALWHLLSNVELWAWGRGDNRMVVISRRRMVILDANKERTSA